MGRFTVDDVLEGALEGKSSVWVNFSEGSSIDAAWVVKIIDYPRKRSLLIEILGGHMTPELEAAVPAAMEEYARDMKCDLMECQGRLGWVKPGERNGWQVVGGLYVKQI